jgi:hypothetical protein
MNNKTPNDPYGPIAVGLLVVLLIITAAFGVIDDHRWLELRQRLADIKQRCK